MIIFLPISSNIYFGCESQPQNPEFRNNPENFHPFLVWACAGRASGAVRTVCDIQIDEGGGGGGGREAQANMKETDRERLPRVAAHDS